MDDNKLLNYVRWVDRYKTTFNLQFLVNSPKGTIFVYSLDISDIFKTAKKVFEMLDEVVDKVEEKCGADINW